MIINTKKLTVPEYVAGISGFLFGVLMHLFGLVNVIHNSDDIFHHPIGYGAGVSSGRWMLTILGEFLKSQNLNYNLGLINGLIFIGFLAVSAGILVHIFGIKSRQLAAILGMALVTFPTAASTLLYKYTSGFYGFAFFLCILAVWVLPKYKIGGLLLSACCTALSLGIYQAYLPVTAAVFVLQLYRQTLEEDIGFAKLLRRGIYACLSLVLGLLLYFALTKLSLVYYGRELSSYQGINSMGQLDLVQLPELIITAFRKSFELPLQDYCNLAPSGLLKIAYWALYGISAIIVVSILLTRRKKPGHMIMALILSVVFPIAVNLIEIMCPTSRIYTLMVFSCVVPLFVPIAFAELLPHKGTYSRILIKISAWVLLVIIALNAYFTNVTYTSTYYVNRQTENYMTSMIAQIRSTEGFDSETQWAFIGTNADPMIDNPWQRVPFYGGAETTNRMVSAYSWKSWIPVYLGYSIPLADQATIDAIMQTQQFQDMPLWPAEGAIQMIDDVIVIKFED